MNKILPLKLNSVTICLALALNFIPSLLKRNADLKAQDIHFTQSSMIPMQLNPALAGTEGDQRAFLNYKNQWRGLSANGAVFNTAFFSVDAAFMKKKWEKGFVGLGLTGFKDVAGDLKLGTTQINLTVSGIVHISSNQILSGGIQGGYVQKSISVAAMQWENQYDPSTGGFNSSIASNDIASLPPSHYGDFSVGLAYGYSTPASSLGANDQVKLNIGVAAQNVNTPKQNFTYYGNDQLYSKYVIHGNAFFGIKNTDLSVLPNAVFYHQGPSNQINIGTLLRYTIKERSKYTGFYKGTAVALGAQYRLKDAIAPTFVIEHANYSFGLSYDINLSGLTTATYGRGGFEIALKYVNPNPFQSAPRISDDY